MSKNGHSMTSLGIRVHKVKALEVLEAERRISEVLAIFLTCSLAVVRDVILTHLSREQTSNIPLFWILKKQFLEKKQISVFQKKKIVKLVMDQAPSREQNRKSALIVMAQDN